MLIPISRKFTIHSRSHVLAPERVERVWHFHFYPVSFRIDEGDQS